MPFGVNFRTVVDCRDSTQPNRTTKPWHCAGKGVSYIIPLDHIKQVVLQI